MSKTKAFERDLDVGFRKVDDRRAGESARLRYVHLDALREDPDNPRGHYDQDKIEGMAQSILTQKQLVPLLVVLDGDGYLVVEGHYRKKAFEYLRDNVENYDGYENIMVLITDNAEGARLHANIDRFEMPAYDSAKVLRKLIGTNVKHGTLRQFCRVNKRWDYNYATKLWKLTELTPEIRKIAETYVITSVKYLIKADKLPKPSRKQLYTELVKNKLSFNEAYNKVKPKPIPKPTTVGSVKVEFDLITSVLSALGVSVKGVKTHQDAEKELQSWYKSNKK